MNERSRSLILRTLGGAGLAAAMFLFLAAAPAEAARPPADRTYFTVLVGAGGDYELLEECLVFTGDEIRSLDGETFGTWWFTEPAGAETTFAYDLTFLDDEGVLTEVKGYGRVDSRGGRVSSLGGAGHVRADGETSNFSFAARQTAPNGCPAILAPPPPPPPAGLVTESRPVSDFHAVSLTGVGRLVIEHTGVESLSVTAEPHILPLIRSEVRDGWLVLSKEYTPNVDVEDILFRLTVRTLDAIDVSGVGVVDVRGVDTDHFSVDVSGVAAVTAAGDVGEQELRLSGVATYGAEGLASRVATVEVGGVCTASVRVSELLRGRVSRPSVLEYFGNPTVDVTGSGTVRRAGD